MMNRWRDLSILWKICLAIFGLMFLIFATSPTMVEYWDGRFPYFVAEFQFLDQEGKPVEGVRFQLENSTGHPRYLHPVADFREDHIPESDENGILKFNCCAAAIGGTCRTYFFLIETGDCDAPKFVCKFFYDGQVIHKESFNELAFEPLDPEEVYETRMLDVSEIDLGIEQPREEEFYVVARTVNITRPLSPK